MWAWCENPACVFAPMAHGHHDGKPILPAGPPMRRQMARRQRVPEWLVIVGLAAFLLFFWALIVLLAVVL